MEPNPKFPPVEQRITHTQPDRAPKSNIFQLKLVGGRSSDSDRLLTCEMAAWFCTSGRRAPCGRSGSNCLIRSGITSPPNTRSWNTHGVSPALSMTERDLQKKWDCHCRPKPLALWRRLVANSWNLKLNKASNLEPVLTING